MQSLEDYKKYVEQNLPHDSLQYLQRGAGDDITLNRNTQAFAKIQVLPRYLRDVTNRTTEATALGKKFKFPIGIAPTGLHKRWHPDGELATARAAESSGTIIIVGAASSYLFEDIASAAPNAEKWLQFPLFDNKSYTFDFIRRAEDAGYGALVVLADAPIRPLRYFNANYQEQHPMVNFERYGISTSSFPSRSSASWEYFKEVVASTKLPVVIKGILTPEDAKLAREYGAKGIIVSNHGGRFLDGSISAIEALANISREVTSDADFEVYFDSGIRGGLDVFRALALGAKFVFIGRPGLWGLSHSGQQGMENVLEIFRHEFSTVMGYAGVVNVDQINSSFVSYHFNS